MGSRDLKASNKGAILGFLWVILSPLIQVVSYVVIVSFIFNVKFYEGAGVFDYALYILSGMIPWQILTRSIQEAPSLIRDNTELVKQVIYPIETMPLSRLIVTSFGALITFCVFMLLLLISENLSLSIIFLPIPTILLFMLILGVSWAFSVGGIILKDLREIVTVVLGLLVYASPVILHEDMVSQKIWTIVLSNPLSHVVICFRDVFFGQFHLISWLIFVTISIVSFGVGGYIITKAKTIINEYI